MDRLFLDANVLFSVAYKPDARVRRLWKLEGVTLCSSRYALEEARINLTGDDQWSSLSELASVVQFYESLSRTVPRGITLPEKDEPILLAAMEARADYLLTGDFQHFGRYLGKKIEGILIATPAQYLRIRNG
jgi:uncharacterized protein